MKKMKKIEFKKQYLFYIFFTLFNSGIYFYTTRNLIFTLVLGLLSILLCFLVLDRSYRNFLKKDAKIKECINFINNFIITLSINNSITTTYNSLKGTFSNELLKIDESLAELQVEDKIEAFDEYFNLKSYEVFIKLLKQYIFNGGDILEISQLLIFDTRKIGQSVEDFKIKTKRKLMEFVSMWSLTILILVIIQLAMSIFYDQILKLSFYPIAILIFFFVFYLFVYLFITKMFDLNFVNFNEEIENEKSKK